MDSIDQTDLMMSEFSSITYTGNGLKSVGGHDDIVFSSWFGVRGKQLLSEDGFGFSFM